MKGQETRQPARRAKTTAQGREVRCSKCGALQYRVKDAKGSLIEIKCWKCGHLIEKRV